MQDLFTYLHHLDCMALCPQCDHSILVHTLLTDDLAAYSCGKCLGTLVSLVAYRAWREKQGKGSLPATQAPNPTLNLPTPSAPRSAQNAAR